MGIFLRPGSSPNHPKLDYFSIDTHLKKPPYTSSSRDLLCTSWAKLHFSLYMFCALTYIASCDAHWFYISCAVTMHSQTWCLLWWWGGCGVLFQRSQNTLIFFGFAQLLKKKLEPPCWGFDSQSPRACKAWNWFAPASSDSALGTQFQFFQYLSPKPYGSFHRWGYPQSSSIYS